MGTPQYDPGDPTRGKWGGGGSQRTQNLESKYQRVTHLLDTTLKNPLWQLL